MGENLESYIDERRTKYHQLQNRLAFLDDQLKNTRTRSIRQDIKTKIANVSYECEKLNQEMRQFFRENTMFKFLKKDTNKKKLV